MNQLNAIQLQPGDIIHCVHGDHLVNRSTIGSKDYDPNFSAANKPRPCLVVKVQESAGSLLIAALSSDDSYNVSNWDSVRGLGCMTYSSAAI